MVTPPGPLPEPPQRLTDPHELFTGYLDYYRDALLRKLDGLSDEQLRTSLVPSGWTPLELLKHLTHVEIRWLRWGFTGEHVDDPWADRGPDDRWHVAADETFEDLRAALLETAEESRRIIAAARIDDFGRPGERWDDPGEPASLIWILFHLLQEYARHVGQLDIVRELIDGSSGK